MRLTKKRSQFIVALDEHERYQLIRALLEYDTPYNVRKRTKDIKSNKIIFDWINESLTIGSIRLTVIDE